MMWLSLILIISIERDKYNRTLYISLVILKLTSKIR